MYQEPEILLAFGAAYIGIFQVEAFAKSAPVGVPVTTAGGVCERGFDGAVVGGASLVVVGKLG